MQATAPAAKQRLDAYPDGLVTLWQQALRDAHARFGALPDLEDLVQDAFVLLMQQEERIENPRAWLRVTTWRLLANLRRTSHSDDELPARREDVGTADSVGLRIDLNTVVRRLTPRERRLLSHLAQGLSHREIAHELGVGWKSVGARVQRLRRKVHRLLD